MPRGEAARRRPGHEDATIPDAPTSLVVTSPIGPLGLGSRDGEALTAIEFLEAGRSGSDPGWRGSGARPAVLEHVAEALAAYFAGALRDFDLPLAPRGTAFQHRVWAALQDIPWGETISYGVLAQRLDLPVSAARAVGSANGANPIPVIIPCHRVIGADGSLTGYAGGLARKGTLLRIEGIAHELDQLPLF